MRRSWRTLQGVYNAGVSPLASALPSPLPPLPLLQFPISGQSFIRQTHSSSPASYPRLSYPSPNLSQLHLQSSLTSTSHLPPPTLTSLPDFLEALQPLIKTKPTPSQPLPPPQDLTNLRQSLLSTFRSEFDAAADRKDQAAVSRFFRLWPGIGAEEEGLEAYGDFVVGLVKGRNGGGKRESPLPPFHFWIVAFGSLRWRVSGGGFEWLIGLILLNLLAHWFCWF